MGRIIIVGAGIVGVCTAYYLTKHAKFDPENTEIIIIEAVRPACAASGKAGGLLSKNAFPAQIVPLSFKLHQELAEEYNGAEAWGFRHLKTLYVEGSRGTKKSVPLPSDLDWISDEIITYCKELGGPESYAQVQPYLFTTYLLRKVHEQSAQLVQGKVTEIHGSKNGAKGVSYIREDGTLATLAADKVIVTTGPWIQHLIPNCPVIGLKAHSITLQPTRQVSAYALFTELRLGRYNYVSPEIFARKDEIFVSGEGSHDPLPDTADKVTVEVEKCDALFSEAGEVSKEIRNGKIIRKQACFLPVVDSRLCPGPFIGKTNVDDLLIATGHSCWGINNAPATGYLMAEIVFDGEASSAELAGLEPHEFFDCSEGLTAMPK